jgi:signal transduction histidine kinase/CheY-like chemotaxis protein
MMAGQRKGRSRVKKAASLTATARARVRLARTRELRLLVQQQASTADILKIISGSKFDLQTVFDTLVHAAVRLCEADMGSVTRPTGPDGKHEHVASVGFRTDFLRIVKDFPISVGRGTLVGRTLLERRTVHIPDVLRDPHYIYPALQRVAGYRTMLGVPLLRDGDPIGVIFLARRRPHPFDERQIRIVSTFADQAVIAIEIARLFDEIQEKSRQLEFANAFKSRFLAAASHDLRQPLHALNLFVAQLAEDDDHANQAPLVGRIQASVSSMNELFNALLDIAKLEAGILESNISEFPVNPLLRRIETTFAQAARTKRLRLTVVPSALWIRSDFILLERILLNFVSNAVRYTLHGGVVVGCRTHGEHVRIEVWDTGEGIPKDQHENIFREFYQLAANEPRRKGGLGLGLAIVQRLALLLDHEIQLSSRPGQGSRFSVTVPRAAVRPEEPEPGEAEILAGNPTHGKLVLVVDDDELVLEAMRGILGGWGCDVVTAASLGTALEALSEVKRQPDLIISDYRLADGHSGIDTIRNIQRVIAVPVPAFLISGDTAPEPLREARSKGYYMLHKPVEPIKLRATVNRLLKPIA